MEVRFIPTREFLESRAYATDSSFIILYTQNSPSLELSDNIASNAQEMLNYTIPELSGEAFFNIFKNTADVRIESISENKIVLNQNINFIDKYLAYNSNTSIVDFVGVFNHTETSLISYPSQEYYTTITPAGSDVWLGCYNTALSLIESEPNTYLYCNNSSKNIWNSCNTYIELQNYSTAAINNTYKITNVLLSNFEYGSSIAISGIFCSKGSTPDDLIIYTSVLLDSENNIYEYVDFPTDSQLFFEEITFINPNIIII